MEHTSNTSYLFRIFTSRIEKKFLEWYIRFFSIKEIEHDSILQWGMGLLLFVLFVTFFGWANHAGTSISSYAENNYSCWPYFQSCGEWFFLTVLPYGYTQSIFYITLLVVMILVVYAISKKDWLSAHIGLTVLLLWKIIVVFIMTNSYAGNFDKYDIFLGTVLLFFPHKLFFIRLTFVCMYFLASTIKIHESWILGTYFTSLKTGLPIFPDILTPVITNVVIFMQIVGAWFLLSKNKFAQRAALLYFICFHLYSGVLVTYRYLATALTALLLYFWKDFRPMAVPLDKKSLPGWLLLGVLFVAQFTPMFLISGDQKLTLEGNLYGFYMFESNHQCMTKATVFYKDGTNREIISESGNARDRCDPYTKWFQLKQMCLRHPESISRVYLLVDHSINGGPFLRIVDTENVCELEYKPFQHNSWIKTEKDNPAIIGYPSQNYYK